MDLTRRGLIGRAAAATGALMGASLVVPRIVHAGAAGETVFDVPVRPGMVNAGREFELIAFDRASVEFRTLTASGWTGWTRARAGHDGARLSDPVWVGPSQAFEVRGRRLPRRATLVDAGNRSASAAATRYADSGLTAGPGQPRIIARSSWATASCRPRVAPELGGVQLAFVHHTVSSNAYRASHSARMVRSICLFHKYGNGWNDIGYNFVVDRYGQIFEARLGGVDEAIVGAQAGGYNVYSTGVALLGYYGGGGPSRKTFDALASLLAWKLTLHGIAVPGTTTVRVTRQGSPYSRYRAGARVRLNHISGHRDADTTECPGGGMYRQLPRLRQVVSRLAGTPSALAIESVGAAPGTASVAGRLTVEGLAIAGATVELQLRNTRGAVTVGSATTNADGTWSISAALEKTSALRALYRGDGTTSAVVSPGFYLAVPPQITLTPATQTGLTNSIIEFTGTTAPLKPKVTIVVSRQQLDGTVTTVRSIRVNTKDDGSFRRSIGFTEPGQYQVIAHTPEDGENALGTSPPVTITIA